MKHRASGKFWVKYLELPDSVRRSADQAFELLKANPQHPSLHFKKVGRYRSARVGLSYRALGVELGDCILWIWIGTHADYDQILR